MEKKGITIAVTLALLAVSGLSALEERVQVGGEAGWDGRLLVEHNLVRRPGFRGRHDLYLRDAREPVRETTDLLLTFDSLPLRDEAGRYRVHASAPEISNNLRRIGAASALFRAGRGSIELEPLSVPGQAAMFTPGTFQQSFDISFWLSPSLLQDGEELIAWDGSLRRAGRIESQRLRVTVENRRLEWEFANLFIDPAGSQPVIRITSFAGLVPRRWQHHRLRYDGITGRLEYLVDDVPEGFTYATSTGDSRGDLFAAYIGELGRGRLRVGTGFSGAMDEFRISHLPRLPRIDPLIAPVRQEPGRFETTPIPLGPRPARVLAIDAVAQTPGDSDLAYFYRVGNAITAAEGLDDPWVPFAPGADLGASATGRYLQVRVDFLPAGTAADVPRLSGLTVRYQPAAPVPRPNGLVATAGDGSVELEWNQIRGFDVSGYLVFYGESPGNYFGESATAGRSPIDVGEVTSVRIDGLTNGRIYYFAVAAYGEAGILDAGALSPEVSARPSRARPSRAGASP
ncbi:MAG: fibronectin type III domain-containing protein [Spirochaetaceae bacterium]|nr:MAG: fibronectin type III domain-containing protein [Spirochaetaceae bacterium]